MGLYRDHLRPRLHALALNTRITGEVRERVCAGLGGDVLEIGYGSGLNQPHLPAAVRRVWAVEPSATALRLGEGRRTASAVPVVVAGDDAQVLPFTDDRFDAALCTWVLCGIPDPGAALAEVARVLKPGAALHFVEHGLAPEPGVVRWQRRGNRINRAIAGCILDNDVRGLLDASPLTVTALDTWYEKGAPRPSAYMYEGRATA
jgi:ubiquinone/menaquinone biosynthesis C-methylase UbiE